MLIALPAKCRVGSWDEGADLSRYVAGNLVHLPEFAVRSDIEPSVQRHQCWLTSEIAALT